MTKRRWSWLTKLFRRSSLEDDIDYEMRVHIEHCVEHLVSQGVPLEEAERRARLEFGSIDAAKEDSRSSVGLWWIDNLRRNFAYGLRALLKTPGWTVSAIVTLALCVGANAAIFSVVDAVLLRPLPYANPNELVQIGRFVRA